jgi:hypothetical protein
MCRLQALTTFSAWVIAASTATVITTAFELILSAMAKILDDMDGDG